MKILTSLVFLLISWTVWACPNCHETVKMAGVGPSGPPWTLIILGVFVACTYIPFYFFFRMTKKYATHKFDEN
jgi:hypothetical protein